MKYELNKNLFLTEEGYILTEDQDRPYIGKWYFKDGKLIKCVNDYPLPKCPCVIATEKFLSLDGVPQFEIPKDEHVILVPFPSETFESGIEIKRWMEGWEVGYKENMLKYPYCNIDLEKLAEEIRQRVIYYNDDILQFKKWFNNHLSNYKKPKELIAVELSGIGSLQEQLNTAKFNFS